MTEKQDGSRGDFSAAGADDRVISERIQELTWALLDEQINDEEFILLDNLLLSDEKAIKLYLGCTQLHADLMTYFAVPSTDTSSNAGGASQILGFLNAESPFGIQSPSGEEAASQ